MPPKTQVGILACSARQRDRPAPARAASKPASSRRAGDYPSGRKTPLRSFDLRIVFTAGVLAASIIAPAGAAQAGNLMAACRAEIAAVCAGISKGRGRISACLIAHDDKLSRACRTEIVKVRNSRTFQRFIPAGFSSLQGSDGKADLFKTCASDVIRLCPRVRMGNGRILACLYSRSNSVSKSCSSEAEMLVRGRKRASAH